MSDDPHNNGLVADAGPPIERARGVVIALHGRGGDAHDVLSLAEHCRAGGIRWVAPQASGHTWYPQRFVAPLSANEPWLSSALRRVGALIADAEAAGIPAERIALVGFSQGACLATEFAARNARRYAAVAALSGGLIGPPGSAFDYDGSLEATPVLLGCSDRDPHIPLERVQETSAVLTRLDARVDERIYPGMGHTINDDELARLDHLLGAI